MIKLYKHISYILKDDKDNQEYPVTYYITGAPTSYEEIEQMLTDDEMQAVMRGEVIPDVELRFGHPGVQEAWLEYQRAKEQYEIMVALSRKSGSSL